MKAQKLSVSLFASQVEKIDLLANRDGSDRSKVLQKIVDSYPFYDLSNIIVRLVELVDRSNVDRMKDLLGIWPEKPEGNHDQAAIIRGFIRALETYLASNPLVPPEMGFRLAPPEKLKALESEPEMLQVLKGLKTVLARLTDTPSLVDYIQNGTTSKDKAAEPNQAPMANSPKSKSKRSKKGHAGPTAHLPKPGDKPEHGSSAVA